MADKRQFVKIGRHLYTWAQTVGGLPDDVEDAWDFWRIAYDVAVGDKWDEQIERPFVQNAPLHLRREAYEYLEEMLDDVDRVRELHEESKSYRNE